MAKKKLTAEKGSCRIRYLGKDEVGVELRFKTEQGWIIITLSEHNFNEYVQSVVSAHSALEPTDTARGQRYAQFIGMRNYDST